MQHIKVIAKDTINRGAHTGCGECQASCQSACKTSCTVANQSCINPRVKSSDAKEQK